MNGSSSRSSRPRSPALALRPLAGADRAAIERLLRATEAFHDDEVAVALELVDAGLDPSKDHGYRFVVAESSGQVVGYACWGEAPCTEGTYDLYWIAVAPDRQGTGVAAALLAAAEARTAEAGGRMMLIETAGKAEYARQRAFYEKSGYAVVARVPDFYRPGDDKLVYGKRL